MAVVLLYVHSNSMMTSNCTFRALQLCITILILCLRSDPVNSEAKFLSHVPYDDDQQNEDYEEYIQESIHDSIVKLPGRYYPKLPYTISSFDHSNIPNVYQDSLLHDNTDPPNEYLSPRTSPVRSNTLTSTQDGDSYSHSHLPQPSQTSTIGRPWAARTATKSDYFRTYPRGTVSTPSLRQQNDQEQQHGTEEVGSDDCLEEPATDSDVVEQEEGLIDTDGSEGNSPHFDRTLARNVTAKTGGTAELRCRVLHLGEKIVSWMKLEDAAILTAGEFRFTTNTRVSIHYNKTSGDWRLKISKVTESDAGAYGCEVSTKPILRFIVHLKVTDEMYESTDMEDVKINDDPNTFRPHAELIGAPNLHLQLGETINLTCLVTHSPGAPVSIRWYFQDKILHSNSVTSDTIYPDQIDRTRRISRRSAAADLRIFSSGDRHALESIYFQPPEASGDTLSSFYPKSSNVYPQLNIRRGLADSNSIAINPEAPVSAGNVGDWKKELEGETSMKRTKRRPPQVYGPPMSPDCPVTKTAVPLVVGSATSERQGSYSCRPAGGQTADIYVHVHIPDDVAAVDEAPSIFIGLRATLTIICVTVTSVTSTMLYLY